MPPSTKQVAPPDEYVPGGDPMDNIARGLFAIARELHGVKKAIQWLGTGDAGSTMGAIEYLATQVKEGAEAVATAIESRPLEGPPPSEDA